MDAQWPLSATESCKQYSFLLDLYQTLGLPDPSYPASTSQVMSPTSPPTSSSRPQTSSSSYITDFSDNPSLTSTPSSGSGPSQHSPQTPASKITAPEPFTATIPIKTLADSQVPFDMYQDTFRSTPSQKQAGLVPSTSSAGATISLAPAAPIIPCISKVRRAPPNLRISTSNPESSSVPATYSVRRTLSAGPPQSQIYAMPPASASWGPPPNDLSSAALHCMVPGSQYQHPASMKTTTAATYQTPSQGPRLMMPHPDSSMWKMPMSAPPWKSSFNMPPYPISSSLGHGIPPHSQYPSGPVAPYSANSPHFISPSFHCPSEKVHYLSPLPEEHQGFLFRAPPPRPRSAPLAAGRINLEKSTPPKASKRLPQRKKSSSSPNRKASGSHSSQFINFTSADAGKLLTGVAPSGSSKRKREEEEAAHNPSKRPTVKAESAQSGSPRLEAAKRQLISA